MKAKDLVVEFGGFKVPKRIEYVIELQQARLIKGRVGYLGDLNTEEDLLVFKDYLEDRGIDLTDAWNNHLWTEWEHGFDNVTGADATNSIFWPTEMPNS